MNEEDEEEPKERESGGGHNTIRHPWTPCRSQALGWLLLAMKSGPFLGAFAASQSRLHWFQGSTYRGAKVVVCRSTSVIPHQTQHSPAISTNGLGQ